MAFDKRLLDIIACPICKGKVKLVEDKNELWCSFDKLAYPIRGDIPVMLPDEARKLELDEVLP
ncbi:Trm112 family protein [Gallaecimonas kandeliae]|uniref:Trm112 family protein n=1 Tax=Gallaecimonas kandeliae TaxID=3029055 RepID=UPI00264A075A|nr:Trm112 family protein [Gallaecimonas kandeliae]WKE67050.1 Trm112 family protein [Gallaecimonas kandeliae]